MNNHAGLTQHSLARKRTLLEVYDSLTSWILGLAFLLAGLSHFGNPYFFLGSVYGYRLVDPGLGQMVAMTLPVIQLIAAVCLLSRLFFDAAHISALFLLTCFAAVQSIAYIRGLDISCGCFGPNQESSIGIASLSLVYVLLFLSLTRNFFCLFITTHIPEDLYQ